MSSTYAAQSHQRSTGHTTSFERRQRLSGLEIMTLIVVAVLLVVGAVAVRPHAPAQTPTQVLQVQAGDTLWSIAQSHPVSGLSTAQTVESIARDNELGGAALAAGQTLVVPASSAFEPQMASR